MILLGVGALDLVSGKRMTGFNLVAWGVDHGDVVVVVVVVDDMNEKFT